MSRRLPPLKSLRAFEAAARNLSFVGAAEELHVTPAAISQQIRLLEDYLGVALFVRGRKLALADAAVSALPLLGEAFDRMEMAVEKMRAHRPGGILVVSAPPAFAARWLIPRLDEFHSAHPEVELRLHATRRLVDFAREDVDAAIRFGSGDYPGLDAVRLMKESIVAVASPGISGLIRSAEDLLGCALIEDESHTENGVFPDWATWLASLGVTGPRPKVRRFGDANLAIQAALSGQGVTLTWNSLVSNEIAAGRLEPLLGHSIPSDLAYHFVVPEHRRQLGNVCAFREWLIAEAER